MSIGSLVGISKFSSNSSESQSTTTNQQQPTSQAEYNRRRLMMLSQSTQLVAQQCLLSSSASVSASSVAAVACGGARRWKSSSSKVNLGHDQPYLQRSTIPTYHFQKSLPRLPIPSLEHTVERYISAVSPLLSGQELDSTKKVASEFLKNEGPKLHKELVEKDARNKHTSFISDIWFDMYLKGRYPVPINSNPFLMMRDDPDSKANEQVHLPSSIIHQS